MGLPHRVLYLVWVGIDDELYAFRERQIRPSALKDVGERQETDNPVALANRHTLVVCFQCGVILAVREHHPFAVARRPTGIKDVAKIVLVGLRPSFFQFALAW